MPSVAVLVALVGNSNLGQVHEDVLHLGVGVGALGTAEVVEPRHGAEEVVDDGDDDGDTDGETPDGEHGDDAGAAVMGQEVVLGRWVGGLAGTAGQPAEDAEEGRDDIDTQDGADQLP